METWLVTAVQPSTPVEYQMKARQPGKQLAFSAGPANSNSEVISASTIRLPRPPSAASAAVQGG